MPSNLLKLKKVCRCFGQNRRLCVYPDVLLFCGLGLLLVLGNSDCCGFKREKKGSLFQGKITSTEAMSSRQFL